MCSGPLSERQRSQPTLSLDSCRLLSDVLLLSDLISAAEGSSKQEMMSHCDTNTLQHSRTPSFIYSTSHSTF